jgi:hypothetical protein
MTNYNDLAQPWSMSSPQHTRLPITPNHPFYYKHWPANWDFMYIEGKQGKKKVELPVFMPSVDIERVVPGVNGVHQIQGELGDPSSRMGKQRQKGYVILAPDQHAFMDVYPAKFGGRYHTPKWERLRTLAGQVVKSFDKIGFLQWKIQLMVDGVIQLPDSHFMELKILSAEKIPDRYIPSQHLPEVRKKLDEQYKIIEDMKIAKQKIEEMGLEYYRGLLNDK